MPFKGVYKGCILGFHNVGDLIIRIGFWGFLMIIVVKYLPPNPKLITRARPLHYVGPEFKVKSLQFLQGFFSVIQDL